MLLNISSINYFNIDKFEITFVKLINITQRNQTMATELTRESLYKETEKTLRAVTSKPFLTRMSEFRNTEFHKRSEFAKKYMTPEALIEDGAPIPLDMRLSSRIFDDSPNFDLVADYDGGKSVISALLKERPSSLQHLESVAPKIYNDLANEYLLKGFKIHPEITSDDPIFDIFIKPERIDIQNPDIYSVNGCAGGGGLTFCGCAGGGT